MNRKLIGLLTFVLIVTAGCVSVPSSREPIFYGIAALEENEVEPIALTSDFAVAVGDIKIPVDFPSDTAFRVDMEVTRFELDLSGELFLVVQWAVVDVGYPKYTIIQRSEFRIPVKNGNYAGAVNAVSDACASLSNQIAKIVYRMSEVPHA